MKQLVVLCSIVISQKWQVNSAKNMTKGLNIYFKYYGYSKIFIIKQSVTI